MQYSRKREQSSKFTFGNNTPTLSENENEPINDSNLLSSPEQEPNLGAMSSKRDTFDLSMTARERSQMSKGSNLQDFVSQAQAKEAKRKRVKAPSPESERYSDYNVNLPVGG